jgi:arylsulfatase A-like enzyme
VITADHGEEFYEHGLPDHGNSLYRRSVHVPLVMVAPGRIPEGTVVATPVTTRSIAATIADLVGKRGDAPFPGPSLTTAWQAPPDSAAPPIILSEVRFAKGLPAWYPVSQGNLLSVFDGRLRSISVADRFEVFDFDGDPDERHDLAGSKSDSAAIARLRRISDSVGRARGGPAR